MSSLNIELIEKFETDVYSLADKDNSFCIFNSINEILFLVYSTIDFSIVFYDTFNKIKIIEIKKAHNSYIIEFRHYLEEKNKYNKRDLILSGSYNDRNIKIWDFNNIECIFNINPYLKGIINSACFLYDNNIQELLIITSNYNNEDNIAQDASIKVFNLKGEELNEMKDSEENILFIDSFYDEKYNKNYIITANKYSVISYDYEVNKLYYVYMKGEFLYDCTSVVIYNKKRDKGKNLKLIYSTGNGLIRIWDFHYGELLDEIELNKGYIFSICLLDEKYLFSCGKSYNNDLIKIKDEKTCLEIIHINGEITCKIVEYYKLGKCLVTKNLPSDGPLKLWKIKI